MLFFNVKKMRVALDGDYRVKHYSKCDSTNNRAKSFAETGFCSRAVFIADAQTAGRGRQGRSFVSPRGAGLYFTVMFTLSSDSLRNTLVTPAAAVAVCETLNGFYGIDSRIKWVNDIYCGGKKICGILTEVGAPNANGLQTVFVGIGVNLKRSRALSAVDTAAALSDFSDARVPRELLAAGIINAFFSALNSSDMLDRYRAKNFLLGMQIDFVADGVARSGMATAIDEKGNLEVDCNGELLALNSNDISVRPHNGG